jgi:hypothetical protein
MKYPAIFKKEKNGKKLPEPSLAGFIVFENL